MHATKQQRKKEILAALLKRGDFPMAVQEMGGPNRGELYRNAFISLENDGFVARQRGEITNKLYYTLTDSGRGAAVGLTKFMGRS
jgi:hypothetical protein